jgi:uncharacterized protein (TIGR03435 family)
MNPVHLLSSEAWVERLGWTLVHFLWQGLSIALLYAAARRIMARRSSPNGRYLLACAALAAMIAAPLATWRLMQQPDASPGSAYHIRGIPPTPSTTAVATATLPDSVRATVPSVQPTQFLAWIVIVWLAGAAAFWFRLAGGWVVAARMRSMLVRRAPPEWQEALRKLGAQIRLARPVPLLVSALVQVPAVVGWLRPVVLVPVGALGGLPVEYLEALLLHELAHIRRHDYLVNMLQSVAEALLFYHPAVWWVSGHIRAEREQCCDDVAVFVSGNALTYARALAHLESHRISHLSAALAANGGSLADRIARLLGQSRPAVRTGLGPVVVTIAVLLATAVYGLFGQSGTHPAFEVATIKRNASAQDAATSRRGVAYKPGGRIIATNAPLRLLIQFAYAAHDSPYQGHSDPLGASQVIGGPAWIDSDGYDIEAKPESNTDQKHAWLMLQTLLADRFRLTLHRETRELPVYNLTAKKSGLKLPPAKDITCLSFPPGTTPQPMLGTSDCGYAPLFLSSTELRIEGRKLHMADLVRGLARALGEPVLDKTGFTGEFDIDLNYMDEDVMESPGSAAPDDAGGNRLAAGPNLSIVFAAMDRLGLQLQPAKGPVEVLVVDHAERPTPN